MFDLHTHSLLSDGDLLPSEVARRYEKLGYKAIAITDHVDLSNIKMVVPAIVEFCRKWPKNRIKVIPGIELTHIPLEQFNPLIKYARKNGIKVIVAHGETISEPVIKGTNKKALSSDIDILAHPGLIDIEDVKLAKRRGVFLEITTRKSHRNTNKHVIRLAKKLNAKLVVNSDSHSPCDIIRFSQKEKYTLKLGINKLYLEKILEDTAKFIGKVT
ncbi:MAG: histidinol phosphate phosphatase domain-containing protein [Candidatus Omnitrophica bacterium]|nr:histidinol phosphate phosphatase domain-containing protein [Candidatus Omnitrophota bacterium]MDD5352478.1 histidinol phosphate phosphatase domain-containing protein [Candidatus Omnitrophota bacterium]MDD5550076.1 histidinol phosphate phosphatase domain-containing protein [Candidatus Omnitrophota bacterium]